MHNSILNLIGSTPLVEISGIQDQKARVAVKIESFNPGGSAKDRVALSMILDAEETGILAPGATIIEPTSGNTGVGIALVGAVRGYKTIFTMPETMSMERRKLLTAYGARIELTPGTEGMQGAIRRANELREAIPGSVILGQFTNLANPLAHERTTGEEIWRDTYGEVDIFVAGVGTGGTITGIARALKAHRSDIKIVAVEPATSAVLSTGVAGPHGIQGIGAGFVPNTYDATVVDEIITRTEEASYQGARLLARRYGILAGISSGAAFSAAVELAQHPENANKLIIVLLPDTGERYLSTSLFDE